MLKFLTLILIVILTLSGCIEEGENLTDKAVVVEEHQEESLTDQLRDAAQEVVRSTKVNEDNLVTASSEIMNSLNFTQLSNDELKILNMLFQTLVSQNNKLTGEVIYKATYLDNYDGDTVTLFVEAAYERKDTNSLSEVNLSQTPLSGKKEIKVRALLVDAPEVRNKKTGATDAYALESKQFIQQQLKNAKSIWLQHDLGDKKDKFGRELMHIWVDNELLNERLLDAGLAKIAYINEPNTTFLQIYKLAEERAKENRIGIWSEN